MIPYLILAISPLAFSLLVQDGLISRDPVHRQQTRKKFLIICGIFLFLFMALRSKYLGSTDTLNYFNMMKRAIPCSSFKEYYDADGVEAGFQLFTYFLSRILRFPQTIIIVSSAIYTISICYTVYRNSDDPVFSMTMYITLGLMVFHLQGMRQSIAMSICLFAYEFAKKRKLIPFILLVLLAMQFHRTAIVFIVVYFLTKLKYNYKSVSVFALASVFIFYFSDNIVSIANVVFDSNYENRVDSGGFIATAIYILIICFAFLFNCKLKNESAQSSILYVTILGGICYLLRYFGALAAERISFYFMFGQLILLPNTLACLKSRERAAVKLIVYFLMIALFAYRLRGSDFIPYRLCFSV